MGRRGVHLKRVEYKKMERKGSAWRGRGVHGEGEEFILIGRGVHREEGDEVYYSLSNKKRGKVGPFSTPIFFYVQNAGGRHATTQQHSTTKTVKRPMH